MSRQRFIYPKIWRSPDFNKLSPDEQLLFIGCFSTADDYGRRRAEPELLKADVFPLRADMDIGKVENTLRGLVRSKLVREYADENGKYMDLPAWGKYQRPKYRKDSDLPAFRANLAPNPGQIGAMGSGCCCGLGSGLGSNKGTNKKRPSPDSPNPGDTKPRADCKPLLDAFADSHSVGGKRD